MNKPTSKPKKAVEAPATPPEAPSYETVIVDGVARVADSEFAPGSGWTGTLKDGFGYQFRQMRSGQTAWRPVYDNRLPDEVE